MSGAAVTRAIMRCAITVGVWRVLVTARVDPAAAAKLAQATASEVAGWAG